MEQEMIYVPWDDFKPALNGFSCPCCMGVRLMPDEEELEQRINDQIDRERIKEAILKLEIETLKKAVEKVECVGNVVCVQTHEQA